MWHGAECCTAGIAYDDYEVYIVHELPQHAPPELVFMAEHFFLAWMQLTSIGLNSAPIDRAAISGIGYSEESALPVAPSPEPILELQSYVGVREEKNWYLSLWTRLDVLRLYLGVLIHAQKIRDEHGSYPFPPVGTFLDTYRLLCPPHATERQVMDILKRRTWYRVTGAFDAIEDEASGPADRDDQGERAAVAAH
jgi:hypothetical protein